MTSLTDITGVSESRAENLREEGFTTVDDVANATESELTVVDGVGDATAPDLIQSARDVLRSTIEGDDGDAEEEAETNTAGGDAEDEEDAEEFPDIDSSTGGEEVTEEDLEGLNGDDGGPDDEPDAEDDEGEPEDVDVTPDEFEVTISLESADEFDYLVYALIDMRLGRVNVTHRQDSIANDLLEEVRPLAGAGEVTLETTEAELNALHALLTQTATAYQGESAVEAFNAIQAVKEQVQTAREEYVL